MSPNLRTARKQLSYPLYGADFDPANPDFLLVGGGGGSTSSGVPNKITLLDTSRFETINEIADIDLAKDEDSVTSLAIAESNNNSLTAYAGINSSLKDQEKGKNEHFRSFRIGLPAKKRKADGSEKDTPDNSSEPVQTQALSRTALFMSATGSKSDVYQRVLRVAPAHEAQGQRLAAIASGLGTKNEVLVFRATPSPGLSNVVSRIAIESGEAADLDLAPVEDEANSHVLSYCTDYDVYLQHIPSSTGANVKEASKVYSTPTTGGRARIRCLRWLTCRYLLLLRNRPAGGGAELVILKTDKDYTQAQLVLVKVLTKSTKQAVGLATCALSASSNGDQQFLVAVAGQDSSLEVFSIDYISGSGMTKFRQYVHLREVHSGPITRITFSKFQAPPSPVSKDTKPQYIRLASVGVDLNVVVQTLPLRPYPAVYTKQPRYVLIAPPETVQNAINILVALLIVGVVGLCMQVFCEVRGLIPPTLHVQSWLSPEWQSRVAVPYPYSDKSSYISTPVIPESMPPIIESIAPTAGLNPSQAAEAGATLLQDLVIEKAANPDHRDKQIIMRNTPDAEGPCDASGDPPCGVEAELHDEDSHEVKNDKTIKKWDQLSEKEKKGWKKRLIEAGHWTEKQGETILKGILFSEIGAAVGAAVRG